MQRQLSDIGQCMPAFNRVRRSPAEGCDNLRQSGVPFSTEHDSQLATTYITCSTEVRGPDQLVVGGGNPL